VVDAVELEADLEVVNDIFDLIEGLTDEDREAQFNLEDFADELPDGVKGVLSKTVGKRNNRDEHTVSLEFSPFEHSSVHTKFSLTQSLSANGEPASLAAEFVRGAPGGISIRVRSEGGGGVMNVGYMHNANWQFHGLSRQDALSRLSDELQEGAELLPDQFLTLRNYANQFFGDGVDK